MRSAAAVAARDVTDYLIRSVHIGKTYQSTKHHQYRRLIVFVNIYISAHITFCFNERFLEFRGPSVQPMSLRAV